MTFGRSTGNVLARPIVFQIWDSDELDFPFRQWTQFESLEAATNWHLINPALVFGVAAFAIPLIIHILNRSRFCTVQWGAMHLLESVIKVNHKRFRFDQLILLLVRCTILVLLALGLPAAILR